jgi:hypothetical protein
MPYIVVQVNTGTAGERTMSHEDAVMIAGVIGSSAFMVSMFIISGTFFIRDKLDTLFRRPPT